METGSELELQNTWSDFNSLRENAENPADVLLENCIELLTENWKKTINWIPGLAVDHLCLSEYALESVPSEEVEDIRIKGCDIQHIKGSVFVCNDGSNHLCLHFNDDCKTLDKNTYNNLHKRKLFDIDNVYGCVKTSKIHVCGEVCSIIGSKKPTHEEIVYYKMYSLNGDSMLVCPISGLSLGQPQQKSIQDLDQNALWEMEDRRRMWDSSFGGDNNKKYIAPKYREGISTASNYGLEIMKNINMHTASQRDSMSVRSKKEKLRYSNPIMTNNENMDKLIKDILYTQIKTTNVREILDSFILVMDDSLPVKYYYRAIAAVKVAALISPHRILEYSKQQDKVSDKLGKMFSAYVSQCKEEGKIMLVQTLLEIVREDEKNKFRPHDFASIPPETMTRFVYMHATDCVQAWYKIISLSDEDANVIGKELGFPQFVDAYLSILKSGLSIDLEDNTSVSVYQKNNFLNMIPNAADDEKAELESLFRLIKKSNNNMKRKIKKYIGIGIKEKNIHYKLYKPDSIDFEKLEEKYFIKIDPTDTKRWKPKRTATHLTGKRDGWKKPKNVAKGPPESDTQSKTSKSHSEKGEDLEKSEKEKKGKLKPPSKRKR